jgi:hypothetical protein
VVTLPPAVAISANVEPSSDLSILNPLSLFALSVHFRSIRVADTVDAVKLVGEAGAAGTAAGVVAVPVFEYEESPPLL